LLLRHCSCAQHHLIPEIVHLPATAKTKEVHASIGQPVCITTGEQQAVVAETQVKSEAAGPMPAR
jgi:hypothetical protein